MCPLQIINDTEPLSLTLHGVNAGFIYHPSNVEKYLIGHKSETTQPKKKSSSKKKFIQVTYFYTFSKFKIPIAIEMGKLFRHITNRHLTAQQTAERSHTQKSKIG